MNVMPERRKEKTSSIDEAKRPSFVLSRWRLV